MFIKIIHNFLTLKNKIPLTIKSECFGNNKGNTSGLVSGSRSNSIG